MKNYFNYIVLILLYTGCYNNLPEATISKIKVTKFRKAYIVGSRFDDQLVLHFTSDVNLDSLHENTSAAMKFTLHCPLDGTNDFDIEGMSKKKYYMQSMQILKDSISNYKYSAEFEIFEGDTVKGSSNRYLKKEEIINLLKNKECIPCKVYTTFYFTGREPYFSKQFCIPAKDILKAL
jgi:hypothetical protein